MIEINKLKQERDELAAQVEVMRIALNNSLQRNEDRQKRIAELEPRWQSSSL